MKLGSINVTFEMSMVLSLGNLLIVDKLFCDSEWILKYVSPLSVCFGSKP